MPNGRREPDHASDFAKALIKGLEKSKTWHFLQKYGATTCWEGEERLVIYTTEKKYVEYKGEKEKKAKVFIWISEYPEWTKCDKMGKVLSELRKKIKELGLDNY